MQQLAATLPPPDSASFAGLLASFAAPAQKRTPLQGLDDLEDDVATLSYERALRVHARYRTPALPDPSVPSPASENLRIFEVVPENVEPIVPIVFPELEPAQAAASMQEESSVEPELSSQEPTAYQRNLKSTSITIRLTTVECERLRLRASEAGLTVSAYLRSCTFEAESLRAMVKDALSKLKPEPSKDCEPAENQARRFGWNWFLRLWTHRRPRSQALQGL
jgi:predicted DNA binding CopG/RHH family protein